MNIRVAMVLLLAVVFALPLTVEGQHIPGYVIPGATAPRDPLPRFTIAPRGGALAPIGLPLPQIGLPSPAIPHARPSHRRGHRFVSWPVVMFYVPPAMAVAPQPLPEPRPVRPPTRGRLILDIQPETSQVFADGYYLGMAADLSAARGGGLLEPGVHRLDVTADGYEPVWVDLRIVPGQLVTYAASLKSLPPPTPAPPSTFYLIPGCYMGNIPPKDARLPASCDHTRTVTWRP